MVPARTGGPEEPTYVLEQTDLATNVRKQQHPIEDGQATRKGTEY